MQTLEQRYAAAVYQCVSNYGGSETSKTRYGVMAQKLPVLIRTAGLTQALAFVEAKATGSNKEPYLQLLDDLAGVLGYGSRKDFLAKSRNADLSEYTALTRRALLALTWFKRFSQSILDVDLTEGDDR